MVFCPGQTPRSPHAVGEKQACQSLDGAMTMRPAGGYRSTHGGQIEQRGTQGRGTRAGRPKRFFRPKEYT